MKIQHFFAFILSMLVIQSSFAEPITVSGIVPDQATKTAILNQLKNVYGTEREVIDKMTIGMVVTPPEWSTQVQRLITPELKMVNRGEMRIQGNAVTLKGNVSGEDVRQSIQTTLSGGLDKSYSFKSELKATPSEQNLLDQTLANRIVEFESGSSRLTAIGLNLLNEMAVALNKTGQSKVMIIGHTDGQGNRQSNITLSKERADEVKAYLVQKGIPADKLSTAGMGPDEPVAPNNTDDGRRRNRRIEFKLAP